MSFQTRGTYDVVACDMCHTVGAVGDTRFRLMRRDASGKSHHLCPSCRVWAEWCEAHQQYHLPDNLHRRACISCGGLFTSRVRLHIEHCPSCLRELAPAVPHSAPGQRAERPARGLAGLVASLARALRS